MTAFTHRELRGRLPAPGWPLVGVQGNHARSGSRLSGVDLGPALRLAGVGVLVGVLLALGGLAWGWVTVAGFDRVPAGTTQNLSLDQDGYVVYVEGSLHLDPADLEIRVVGQGTPLAVHPAPTTDPVSLFGLTEQPVGVVMIPSAGVYEVSAVGPHGLPVAVALGDHDAQTRVFVGLGLGVAIVLIATAAGVGRTLPRPVEPVSPGGRA